MSTQTVDESNSSEEKDKPSRGKKLTAGVIALVLFLIAVLGGLGSPLGYLLGRAVGAGIISMIVYQMTLSLLQ